MFAFNLLFCKNSLVIDVHSHKWFLINHFVVVYGSQMLLISPIMCVPMPVQYVPMIVCLSVLVRHYFCVCVCVRLKCTVIVRMLSFLSVLLNLHHSSLDQVTLHWAFWWNCSLWLYLPLTLWSMIVLFSRRYAL